MTMRLKPSLEYTFVFSGILDQLKRSKVKVINGEPKQETTIYVSVNEADFLNLRGLQVKDVIADVVDLGTAISVADRWAKRDREYPCHIHIKLPVRRPDVLCAENIMWHLQRMLDWFTGDIWTFEFVPINEQRRTSELQLPLWKASNAGVSVEVALWSGGLDAFAGLCCQIRNRVADRYLLLGEGSNSLMKGVQERVFEQLKAKLNADLHLVQIATAKSKSKREKTLPKNGAMRTRGLVFMLLGSAYAHLEGQNSLSVYENGIGAINLPFRASEVGLDHARSVHLLSLQFVSRFFSMLIGEQFRVHNPFQWITKGEMCRVLDEMDVTEIAWQTVSCDRPHHRDTPQCGGCSSCLLRRQSFLAAETLDKTGYLIETESGEILDQLLRKSQLAHMLFQVKSLKTALQASDSWTRLAYQHPTRLADLVQRLIEDGSDNYDFLVQNILSLYERYTAEWSISTVRALFSNEIKAMKRVPTCEKSDIRQLEEGNLK